MLAHRQVTWLLGFSAEFCRVPCKAPWGCCVIWHYINKPEFNLIETREALKQCSSAAAPLWSIFLFKLTLQDLFWILDLCLGLTAPSLSLAVFSGQAGETWIHCMYISNDSCRNSYRFQTSSKSGQAQLLISTRPGMKSKLTHTRFNLGSIDTSAALVHPGVFESASLLSVLQL